MAPEAELRVNACSISEIRLLLLSPEVFLMHVPCLAGHWYEAELLKMNAAHLKVLFEMSRVAVSVHMELLERYHASPTSCL